MLGFPSSKGYKKTEIAPRMQREGLVINRRGTRDEEGAAGIKVYFMALCNV